MIREKLQRFGQTCITAMMPQTTLLPMPVVKPTAPHLSLKHPLQPFLMEAISRLHSLDSSEKEKNPVWRDLKRKHFQEQCTDITHMNHRNSGMMINITRQIMMKILVLLGVPA